MKKILTAVLAMALALFMLSGVCAEAAGVTGTWYGEIYGMVYTMTINEDGSYTLERMGESVSGEWVLEGTTLYVDKGTDYEDFFVYDEAAQTLTVGDVVFGREVIEEWMPAAARAAAVIEDFAGNWTATHVYAFGGLLPVDDADIYMDAAIEATAVTLTIEFVGEEIREGDATLADGVMTLIVPAADEYSEDETYVISALEDGTISIATEMITGPATFYLSKVEA